VVVVAVDHERRKEGGKEEGSEEIHIHEIPLQKPNTVYITIATFIAPPISYFDYYKQKYPSSTLLSMNPPPASCKCFYASFRNHTICRSMFFASEVVVPRFSWISLYALTLGHA
jgi:hypothetical protein